MKVKKLGIENLNISIPAIKIKPFSEQNLKKKLELFLKSIESKSKEERKKGAKLLSGLLIKKNEWNYLFEAFEIILKEDRKAYKKNDLGSYLSEKIRDLIRKIEKAENFPITDEKELRKQLYAYTRDNRIKYIVIKNLCISNSYEKGTVSIPIEYASCLILGVDKFYKTQLINPKNTETILFVPKEILMLENVTCNTLFCDRLNRDVGKNVSCKTIICQASWLLDSLVNCLDKIKNLETVLIDINSNCFDEIKKGVDLDKDDKKLIKCLAEKNISLQIYNNKIFEKLFFDYEEYIRTKRIVHLSGYVNVKNKPNELSDKEWEQVLVLKQKVKGIIKKIQTESIKTPAIK